MASECYTYTAIEGLTYSGRTSKLLKEMARVENELNDPLLVTVEGFTAELLEDKKTFPLQSFIALCLTAGLTFDELYRQYAAKNVLNIFRQDHGYKTGEYVKIWNGEEDNVHLMRLMDFTADADSVVGELPDLLYQGLVGMYKTVKAAD